jgi:hypothetical protein
VDALVPSKDLAYIEPILGKEPPAPTIMLSPARLTHQIHSYALKDEFGQPV